MVVRSVQYFTYTENLLMIILAVHGEILTWEEGIHRSDGLFELYTVLVDLQEVKENCNHLFEGWAELIQHSAYFGSSHLRNVATL